MWIHQAPLVGILNMTQIRKAEGVWLYQTHARVNSPLPLRTLYTIKFLSSQMWISSSLHVQNNVAFICLCWYVKLNIFSLCLCFFFFSFIKYIFGPKRAQSYLTNQIYINRNVSIRPCYPIIESKRPETLTIHSISYETHIAVSHSDSAIQRHLYLLCISYIFIYPNMHIFH